MILRRPRLFFRRFEETLRRRFKHFGEKGNELTSIMYSKSFKWVVHQLNTLISSHLIIAFHNASILKLSFLFGSHRRYEIYRASWRCRMKEKSRRNLFLGDLLFVVKMLTHFMSITRLHNLARFPSSLTSPVHRRITRESKKNRRTPIFGR